MNIFESIENKSPSKIDDNDNYEKSIFKQFDDYESQNQDPLEQTFNPSEEHFSSSINEPSDIDKFFEELKQKEQDEKDYNERSFLGKTIQNISGLAARGAETIAGVPSDLKSFADFMLVDLPEYASGKEVSPSYRKFITGNPAKPGTEDYQRFEEEKPSGLNFPSSNDIREGITKPLTAEYLEPQSSEQKFSQDTFQDIVRFFMPGSSANRFTRLSPYSKVAIPIYANIGKKIADDLGFSPFNQELIKMGLMFGMDVHGRARTRDYAADLINRAERMVQPGQMMDATYLMHRLEQIERNLQRGGSSPSTNRALKAIQEVRDRVNNGQIEIADIMAFRKRLNDVINTGGGYDVPAASRPLWTRNMQKVKNRIVNAVDRELRNSNPQAAELWRQGNQAYSVFSRSNRMGNWMRSQTKKPLISNSLKLLLPAVGYSAGESIMKHLPQAMAIAGPTYGAIKSYQIITRAFRSPTIRRYYRDVVNSALTENSLNYNKSLQKLDRAMKEEEAKDPLLSDLIENQ